MNKYRVRIYRTVDVEQSVMREIYALNRHDAFNQAAELSNQYDQDCPTDYTSRVLNDDRYWYADDEAVALLVGIEPKEDSDVDSQENASTIETLKEARNLIEKQMGDQPTEEGMDMLEKINATIQRLT